MQAPVEPKSYLLEVEAVLEFVRPGLVSDDAVDRVRAAQVLSAAVELLERQVVADANAAGASWATIATVYGTSRQAVHQRFANESIVPAAFFDWLASQDDDEAPSPALARAAERADAIVKNRERVPR